MHNQEGLTELLELDEADFRKQVLEILGNALQTAKEAQRDADKLREELAHYRAFADRVPELVKSVNELTREYKRLTRSNRAIESLAKKLQQTPKSGGRGVYVPKKKMH